MDIIVMKFGGTSVHNQDIRYHAYKHIRREIEAEYKVLVIVSAMGRLGEPYSTDSLKELVSNQISKQESDRLLSCGEIISSIVLSNLLQEHGLNVSSLAPWQLGIKTNSNYGSSDIIDVNQNIVLEQFIKYDVLIAPGFVGLTDDGHIATLGRGGSDTSAIALGSVLKAKYVDIYSDVEGVMTTDPKLTKGAKLFNEISYNNLISLAAEGARIIQLKAIEFAKKDRVKLRFRSTRTDYIGTYVVDEAKSHTAKLQKQ